MRHLISYNFKFSPGMENHVYVSEATEAEMHIDYAVEGYIDDHIKGPGYFINDYKIIYAYSPEIPGACVVYLHYAEKDKTFARLHSVGYVYKEDSPFFNIDMFNEEMNYQRVNKPIYRLKFVNFKDELYTLHGKQQSTELPWD